MPKLSVSLIDDHVMLRNGLARLIDELANYKVVSQSDNGRKFINEVAKKNIIPDIVLLDVSMPIMNGYDTAKWIRENMPETKILVLSMFDDESSIIKMIKNGANGYILKDSDPKELELALNSIQSNGYYHSDLVNGKIFKAIITDQLQEEITVSMLSDNEILFLKYSCSDMTYVEIAKKMSLSVRTIEGYRDKLFIKLKVKTKVGLVLYAIKNGIINI
jgi:two-component system, NarL family, invasion response regulator UvrY